MRHNLVLHKKKLWLKKEMRVDFESACSSIKGFTILLRGGGDREREIVVQSAIHNIGRLIQLPRGTNLNSCLNGIHKKRKRIKHFASYSQI